MIEPQEKQIYPPDARLVYFNKNYKEERTVRGMRSKKVGVVKESTLIATIDIGMTSNTGFCSTIDGRDIKPFRFENTREGFDKFWDMIITSKNRFVCDEVIIGYESTGPYAEPLVHYLRNKPVKIVQVNPMHTKRMKEVNDNSPLKTDDKDPRVIADIIRLGHALTVVIPEGHAAYLRRLNNARERHVKERTALLNQLQQLVFLVFPELKTVLKDIKVKTTRYILAHHTTPETIEGFIAEIEFEMERTLSEISYSIKLLSIKGLGVVSVAGIIGEIGDFSKFSTQSEIMKLAGLDLYEISSGKRKGERRISKRGRSLLRKILYYAAIQTIRKNGIMCEYYAHLITGGMKRMMALVAIARKLLRIIFAIARDNSEYKADYVLTRKVIKKAA